jgi:transcriptional regulator with XRE-family HTH domain
MGECRFEPNPVDEGIGKRIMSKRTEIGLSQGHMADQLELSLDEYQDCESGIRRFGAQLLLKISQLLGVDPQYFFETLAMRRAGFINWARVNHGAAQEIDCQLGWVGARAEFAKRPSESGGVRSGIPLAANVIISQGVLKLDQSFFDAVYQRFAQLVVITHKLALRPVQMQPRQAPAKSIDDTHTIRMGLKSVYTNIR